MNPDTIGLDYASAREATPRWYGVSFGNGNNGVSHMFPDYYVRTTDPWGLARVAAVASFKGIYQAQANEELYIDGEADYTIYAIIHDPFDYEPEDEDDEGYPYAWFICEVFPIEDAWVQDVLNGGIRTVNARANINSYTSMEDAFTELELSYRNE